MRLANEFGAKIELLTSFARSHVFLAHLSRGVHSPWVTIAPTICIRAMWLAKRQCVLHTADAA